MKKLLLASTVILLPISAQSADLYSDTEYNFIQDNAPSQPRVVGHLSLGLGYFDFSPVNDELDALFGEDGWLFEGAARANVELSGAFNLEIETGGASTILSDLANGFSYSSIGAAGHLWGKTPGAAFGIYGAVNFPTGFTVYTAGVEGEIYLGPITLGADGNYNWADGGPDDYWSASAWADLYITSNFRIGAEGKYYDIENGFWSASVDAETRFAGTPFSLWAAGTYLSADGGADAEVDVWTALAGFRIFLDGSGTTLKGHDRQVPWDNGLFDTTLNAFAAAINFLD